MAAVAVDLGVLGGPEPVGLEAEHHQQPREPERRQQPDRLEPALHRPSDAPAASRVADQPSPIRSTARNASCGISTDPIRFMRCLPSFCFSSSFFLRVKRIGSVEIPQEAFLAVLRMGEG